MFGLLDCNYFGFGYWQSWEPVAVNGFEFGWVSWE